MADHFSGPSAIADPAADITDLYVFPSPERPGHLVLVLNVFPAAAPGALFSDALAYRFRLRPVTVDRSGVQPRFAVSEAESVVTFTFAAPLQRDGSGRMQTGTCTLPSGTISTVTVNDESDTASPTFRLFAGLRLDPFFFDMQGVEATNKLGRIAFRPDAPNILAGQNVLSIVIEAETSALVGTAAGSLVAVAAEIVTLGSRSLRLERMGRPEIKNVVLSPKEFDTVNRDLEIRDLYNLEDPFRLSKTYSGAYRARFNANLAFFDGLDGKSDWPLDEHGNHPLTELLLADFLVVDVAKPYAEQSYFAIEQALLQGANHQACGGRPLNDDIVEILYNVMVNAGNGPHIQHGVKQATQPASDTFPYLVRPNPNPPDLRAKMAAQSASKKEQAA